MNTMRKYMCPECGKSFSRVSHLLSHARIHTGERPYKCYYCNHPFTEESNLIKHVRIHLGKRPYICTICHKDFTLKKNMIDHERTHSGEKPHKCTICQQRFTRNNSLVRHLRIHTGEKYYECYECPKKFAQKGSLQRHILTVHLNVKSWQPRTCDDIPTTEDPIQPVLQEIVFVNCGNPSGPGDDFAMDSNIMEESPVDETSVEIQMAQNEAANVGRPFCVKLERMKKPPNKTEKN